MCQDGREEEVVLLVWLGPVSGGEEVVCMRAGLRQESEGV